jgi:hypothetical protein
MNAQPCFRFFLSTDARPIDAADALWHTPLPPGSAITYADYFLAICAYLSQHHFDPLLRALPPPIRRLDAQRVFEEIGIYLEKHGAHYHPARIVIPNLQPPRSFVVNVAVTPAAKKMLQADFGNLKRLNRRYGHDFIPRVYHCGDVPLDHGRILKLFLGQWLDGYHEFHAGGFGRDKTAILLWDPVSGPRTLSCGQVAAVYRRAAAVLTAYYHPYRFDHIADWHHAAGDFIARVDTARTDVKLITVRSYGPLLQGVDADPETVLQGMLLFILQLSLRMRLDRLAGTGDMVWLDDGILAATLAGFWDGLDLQAARGAIPGDFGAYFLHFLQALSAADLFDLLSKVADRFPPRDSGTSLVRDNLVHHRDGLLTALKNRPGSR